MQESVIPLAGVSSRALIDMPTFALVRWLNDESVTAMPLSALKDKNSAIVGATVDMIWTKGKTYEAEILKISSEQFSVVSCGSIVKSDSVELYVKLI